MISGIGRCETYRISSMPPLYNIIVELSAYLLEQRSEHSIIDGIQNEIYDHTMYKMIILLMPGALTRPHGSGCCRRNRWATRCRPGMDGGLQWRR